MSKIISDPRLDAWRGFLTLHAKIIEVIDADLQSAGGLPLRQYDVLIELFEEEGKALRMYELAQRVVLSRSSITRLVDQLAHRGLLTRQADRTDRRGAYAVLTEAGERAVRASWPVYRAAILRHFGSWLADEEAALLAQIFTRISAAIEAQA